MEMLSSCSIKVSLMSSMRGCARLPKISNASMKYLKQRRTTCSKLSASGSVPIRAARILL